MTEHEFNKFIYDLNNPHREQETKDEEKKHWWDEYLWENRHHLDRVTTPLGFAIGIPIFFIWEHFAEIELEVENIFTFFLNGLSQFF